MTNVAFTTTIAKNDGTTATSLSANLTTAANNLVIAVVTTVNFTTAAFRTVSTLTGGGLTWQRRSQNTFNATVGPYFLVVEVWWAYTSTSKTNQTITATYSGAPSRSHIHLLEFSGVSDTTNPFTSTTPAIATRNNGSVAATPSVAWSPARGNNIDNCALIAAMVSMNVGTAVTAGGGATMRSQTSNADEASSVEGLTTSGITSANQSFTGAQNFFLMVVDLITPASGAISGNAPGQIVSATSSVIAGAGHGGAVIPAQTKTVTASVIAGVATPSVTTDHNMIPVFPSVIAGTARGDSNAAGATLPVTSSVSGGTATGGANAGGHVLSAVSALIPGDATSGGMYAGDVIDVDVVLIAGTAVGGEAGDAFAPGSIIEVGASIVAGTATGDANAAGRIVETGASVIAGTATGEQNNDNPSLRVAGVGVGYRKAERRDADARGAIVACGVSLIKGIATGQVTASPARGVVDVERDDQLPEVVLQFGQRDLAPVVVLSANVAGADFEARASVKAGEAKADNTMIYDLLALVA